MRLMWPPVKKSLTPLRNLQWYSCLGCYTPLLWNRIVSPQNSYVKAIHNATILGNRIFKELIKVKWGHKGRTPVQCDGCPYKKRDTGWVCMWGHSAKVVVCRPGKEASVQTNLDLRLPDPRTDTFLLFKPPSLWFFVMAAWVLMYPHSEGGWSFLKCIADCYCPPHKQLKTPTEISHPGLWSHSSCIYLSPFPCLKKQYSSHFNTCQVISTSMPFTGRFCIWECAF